MSVTAAVLLALVSWTLLLVMSLGVFRSAVVLGGAREANSFSASGEDIDGFGKRLTRAHANCYEFLPAAGLVLLYAIATEQTAITDGLAYVFLGARLLQSLTHIASTANAAVLIRFGFFGVQLGVMVYWLLRLFGHI